MVASIDGRTIIQQAYELPVSYPAAWSPDGKKIAITVDGDVYTMNLDGSNAVNLTHHQANDQRPSWSPDGKYIVFGSSRDNVGIAQSDKENYSNNQLYLMNSDGTGVKQLTSYGISSTFPVWSPDGQSIAFTVLGEVGGIYIMDVGTTKARKVLPGGYWLSVSWSPDSRFLAVVQQNTELGKSTLFTFNIANEALVSITTLDGSIAYPSWGK